MTKIIFILGKPNYYGCILSSAICILTPTPFPGEPLSPEASSAEA